MISWEIVKVDFVTNLSTQEHFNSDSIICPIQYAL